MNADFMALAKSVANSIEQDKMGDALLEMDADLQKDFLLAYVDHAIRKIEQFKIRYFTDDHAKNAFRMNIFLMLGGQP